MRVTQGTFSFLPDLADEQVRRQLSYALGRGWAVSIEHTDEPHPFNVYWEMWGRPMFDLSDPAAVMEEVKACRAAHPDRFIKIVAFDATRGWETVRLSFLVHRPRVEPTFELVRQQAGGRRVRYAIRTRPARSGGSHRTAS